MKAATIRANAAASNIANAGTTGAREGADGPAPYVPLDVVQTSAPDGTAAQTIERNPSSVPAYQPDAAFADNQGLVAAPNVDLAGETVDLQQAATAYKANAAVARVANEISHEFLNRFDETV
jgi:flagellar basal-body rod protein FlgC